MKKFKNMAQIITASDVAVPVIVLISYLTFVFIAKGSFPSADEFVTIFRHVYKQYGYEIIFISALLESLVLINILVPGSLALALGAVFAKSGELDLSYIVVIAAIGANLGFIADYFLGQLGFENLINKLGYGKWLKTIEKRINKKTLIFAFINPNLGSFFALSAGIIKLPLKTFFPIAVVSTLCWFSLWGILFYITGDVVLEIFTKYFVLIVLIIIGFTFLAQIVNKKEKK